LEFPYRVHPVDITKGDQLSGDVLRTSLNNKIPAIVDAEAGTTLVESGAILTYLADKTRRLIPSDGAKRYRVLEWLW
jgi:GST-like protein